MSVLQIDGFNLATIYVDDLKQTQAFYTDILGFEKKADMGTGIIMHHDLSKFTIYLQGGRKQRESSETMYPTVSICFNSQTGVKAALEALKKADVPIVEVYGKFDSEFAGFHFKDPSGNIFEIAGTP